MTKRPILRANGKDWLGWKSLSIKQSMGQAAHSLSITSSDRFNEGVSRWNVRGGSEIEVLFDNSPEIVFAGYVTKYSASITPSGRSITIEGASKAIDAVECSHIGKLFWPAGTDPAQIFEDVLRPFGINSVTNDLPLAAIPKEGFRAGANDTAFQIVRKLAEKSGHTVYTNRFNDFIIAKETGAEYAGQLGRGDYTQFQSSHDLSEMFSSITMRAQQNDYDEAEGISKAEWQAKQQVSATRDNPISTRYRPTIFVANGDGNTQEQFADYVNRRFAGEGAVANVTVKDYRSPNGTLWGINQRVWIDEPLADIRAEMLIQEVEFNLSESGFETRLTLAPLGTFYPVDLSRRQERSSSAFFDAVGSLLDRVF